MTDIIEYAIRGIPIGCVFALVAIGVVLTYKTSGVLNLAFGAQAYVSAAVFYVLHSDTRLGWPMLPSVIVSVVLLAPAIGWLLDRALYRHLRTAPPVAKLVVSLGLLVAIPQIVRLDVFLGSGALLRPPGLATEEVYRVGEFGVDGNQLTTIVMAVLALVGLTVLFRRTNLGLQMRAVVESPRMTQLAGVDADRVGSISWMLSSFFAGLAGVLVAPLFAQLSDLDFFTLLVAALAAAVFARLTSIPLAFLGGVLLGVGQAVAAGLVIEYVPGNTLATGFRSILPFATLFLLLLFWPGLRDRPETTDPLAGVDPPPPAPSAATRPRWLTILTRVLAAVTVVVGVVVTLTALDEFWLRVVTKGVVLAVIFLSITVVVGFAGQISLCQAAFAAIGAFTTAQLAANAGMSVLLAMVVGAAVAGAVGAVIALPALRLGGIYLALATLAFAIMFENVIAPLEAVKGRSTFRVPRPLLAGIDFTDNRLFLLLSAALLAIVGALVLLIRSGTTGRFMTAMRGSETGAASIGISTARTKITAFAVSAAIAGFGGGLLASFEKQMSGAVYQANFTYVFGLVWVVLVITLGARSVQAGIIAGVMYALFPKLLELLPFISPGVAQSIAFILFGLGALTYARHPEGIVEAQTNRVARLGRKRAAT